MSVEVFPIGPPPDGIAVVGTAIGATRLDQLTDVDGADGAAVGQVLVYGPDGQWRPAVPGAVGLPVLGHRHTQTTPVTLVQITHGLTFDPAGVTAVDTQDAVTEHDTISHPLPGVTELTYGAPFAGVVYLS